MKVKVEDLNGYNLEYAARLMFMPELMADDLTSDGLHYYVLVHMKCEDPVVESEELAIRLMESKHISVSHIEDKELGDWQSEVWELDENGEAVWLTQQFGETVMEAVLRSALQLHFGEYVDLPEALSNE